MLQRALCIRQNDVETAAELRVSKLPPKHVMYAQIFQNRVRYVQID